MFYRPFCKIHPKSYLINRKGTVSSPPALTGGDEGSVKSGKLGGKWISENNWGGMLNWGGWKISGGDGKFFIQKSLFFNFSMFDISNL